MARAKRLGLSLEEITELLDLLRDDECRPVQTRMRHLVTNRIAEAQQQVADLVAFTAQLQETASRLTVHTPDGACDEECGCRTDPAISDSRRWEAVTLAGAAFPAVAWSLEPGLVGSQDRRLEDNSGTGRGPRTVT